MISEMQSMIGRGWAMHCADSIHWLRNVADNTVDAVITDPPYSSGGQFRGDRMASVSDKYQNSDSAGDYPEFYGDNRDQRSYLAWCTLWLADAWRTAKDGAPLVVSIDWRMLPTMTDAIQAGGWVWRGIVPWRKPNARRQHGRFAQECEFFLWGSKGAMPFDRGVGSLPGFFQRNSVPSDERQHVTEKPIDGVMREVVRIAKPGDLILDPFAGSGSTGVAALIEDRAFIGVEMSRAYFDIAIERFRALENLEHRKDSERGQIGLFSVNPNTELEP